MNRRRRDKSNLPPDPATNASDCFSPLPRVLFIDGYNLLHVTRFQPRRGVSGDLQRGRERLLHELAAKLPAPGQHQVLIAFDAPDRRRPGDTQVFWQTIEVVFVTDESTADDALIERIRVHADPAHLGVVSSDHRVQLAARRRGARYWDSDAWYEAFVSWQPEISGPTAEVPELKSAEDALTDDVAPFSEEYLREIEREFSDEDESRGAEN